MFSDVKPVTHTLGLVGDSITGSYTPPMHEMMGRQLGMSVAYHPIDFTQLDIGPDDLAEVLTWARRLGFTGLNITAPCKQQVIPLLDELSDRAQALHAVNTVVFDGGRMVGHNTDWCGFIHSLQRNLPDAKLDRVVLMGAGGAGSAVAYGLLDAGVQELTVFDLDAERQQALVDRMNGLFGGGRTVAGTDVPAAMGTADGLVHATTFGMTGHQPGTCVPVEHLRPEMWVADCVYLPLETELITQARARGCAVLPGGGMAAEQAIEAFRIFTGVEPDAQTCYRDFEALLGSKDH